MVELVEYVNKIKDKKKEQREKSIKRVRTFLDSITRNYYRGTRSMYVDTLSDDTDNIWQAMYVNYGPNIDDSVFEGMRY